jgi:hypothetical protein
MILSLLLFINIFSSIFIQEYAGAHPTTSEFTTTSVVPSRLERFSKWKKKVFVFKTHESTRGVVNFYIQRRRGNFRS